MRATLAVLAVASTASAALTSYLAPAALAAVSLFTKPVPNTGANTKWIDKKFVVPHTPGADDSPAVIAALANYTANATILFKSGVTYNIWTVRVCIPRPLARCSTGRTADSLRKSEERRDCNGGKYVSPYGCCDGAGYRGLFGELFGCYRFKNSLLVPPGLSWPLV